jgi:putative transposase
MRAFIDRYRNVHGVEPICRVLQIAPSGYRRHAARQRTPALRSPRAQRDAALVPHIERVWRANLQVYGAKKVWRQLHREGYAVARCTVERLMRRQGLRGVIRGKVVRTTVADAKAPCPLDKVNRQFKASRPNQLWVSDFTYVSTWQGWLYVAFVIDVFARRIVGWRVSSSNTSIAHGRSATPSGSPSCSWPSMRCSQMPRSTHRRWRTPSARRWERRTT